MGVIVDKKRLSYTLISTGLILIFMPLLAINIYDGLTFNLFIIIIGVFTRPEYLGIAAQIVIGIILVVVGNKMKI